MRTALWQKNDGDDPVYHTVIPSFHMSTTPATDAAVWKSADGIGSIEVLEVFGNDLTVVNAARVSFNKTVTEFGPRDAGLIKFLAKHDHISPFFHPQIRLRIKMPIFVAREWYRHTIGFARNEVSRRYVDYEPEVWYPQADGLRARDPKLKQGSKEEPIENADSVLAQIRSHGEDTVKFYNQLLEQGVAPEIARAVLPQGMYTEFIETASLAAYARLWKLRTDPGAQREIQAYARAIETLLLPYFPVSWAALTETPVIPETPPATH
jgi:thymidylate synthase (FAD)